MFSFRYQLFLPRIISYRKLPLPSRYLPYKARSLLRQRLWCGMKKSICKFTGRVKIALKKKVKRDDNKDDDGGIDTIRFLHILPNDVLVDILSRLDVVTLCRCASVSTQLSVLLPQIRHLATTFPPSVVLFSEPSLWNRLLARYSLSQLCNPDSLVCKHVPLSSLESLVSNISERVWSSNAGYPGISYGNNHHNLRTMIIKDDRKNGRYIHRFNSPSNLVLNNETFSRDFCCYLPTTWFLEKELLHIKELFIHCAYHGNAIDKDIPIKEFVNILMDTTVDFSEQERELAQVIQNMLQHNMLHVLYDIQRD